MARIAVTLEVEIPDQAARVATNDQIRAWLEFSVGANGHLYNSPVSEVEFEARPFSVDFRWIEEPKENSHA